MSSIADMKAASQKAEHGVVSLDVENFDISDVAKALHVYQAFGRLAGSWEREAAERERSLAERQALFDAKMAERQLLFALQLQTLGNREVIGIKKLDVPGVEDVAESDLMGDIVDDVEQAIKRATK